MSWASSYHHLLYVAFFDFVVETELLFYLCTTQHFIWISTSIFKSKRDNNSHLLGTVPGPQPYSLQILSFFNPQSSLGGHVPLSYVTDEEREMQRDQVISAGHSYWTSEMY